MNMWINCVVTLASLLFTVKYSSAKNVDLYEIPIPEIEVFTTGGLRISIPEETGISVFRFHGNINQEIQPLRQGTINLETHQQSTRGNWILETKNPLLKRGDIISYWIFVKKDRLGYVRQPHSHKVTELVPNYIIQSIQGGSQHAPLPHRFPIPPLLTTRTPLYYPTAPPMHRIPITTSSATEGPIYFTTQTSGINQDPVIFDNKTESVAALQDQIETLSDKVDLLIGILEKIPNAKKLTISGRILDDENPSATVRFLLWEKLDLKPKIISAERNNDGSITFQTATLEEKTLVLKLAQEKLQNATIKIF